MVTADWGAAAGQRRRKWCCTGSGFKADLELWLIVFAGLGAAALIDAAMMRLNLMVRMTGDGFGFEFVSCCLDCGL
jgi:hypothetical protein